MKYFFKNDWRNMFMYSYILNSIWQITVEIARLEDLSEEIRKSRSSKRKREYEDNIKWCKEEKENMLDKYCPDKIIEKLNLTDDEKKMARLHYIEGMSWSEAYYETDEYLDFDDSDMDDEEASKEIKKKYRTHQRRIERKVNIFNAREKRDDV